MNNSDQTSVVTTDSAAIWIWDPDRLRIVWANEPGLIFWGERSLLDLIERDFAPFDEAVYDFGELIRAVLTRKSGRVRARMVLAPEGKPIRVDCRAQHVTLSDGRPGLRVEAVRAPVGDEAEVDRLREIIERTPTAISLFAEDGSLLMQNSAAEQSFGAELESLTQRYDDRSATRDALRSLLVNGSYSQAVDLQTRVGIRRHRVTMRRMHDPMTGGLAAIVFFTDIADRTESVVAGATPAVSDATNFLSSLSTGAIVFDDALKLLYVNEFAKNLLALSDERHQEGIGVLFPEQRKDIADALTAIRDGQSDRADLHLVVSSEQGGTGHNIRMEVRRGDWRGAAAWLATLSNATGQVTPATLTARLVDQRDRLLDVLGVGIVTLRKDGVVESVNSAGAMSLGAEEAVLIGRAFDAGFDETSVRAFRGALANPAENAKPFLMERSVENEDRISSLRIAISPLAVDSGQTTRTLAFVELKNGDRSKGTARSEAIARASHELRTPLNAIIGFTQIMMDDPGAIHSEAYREYLKDIHDSGQYMARLVQDMLDLRRIEAGALSLDLAPVNVGNLIRRVARDLDSAARARGVTLSVSLEELLPTVTADAHTLRQALTNLIGNAVKFTTDMVRVSASIQTTGELRIDVSDNGEGMTEEEVDRALQPYSQGKGSSRKFGGAGMGLPLAKGFIEANSGTFEILSRKSEGTVTRITFSSRVLGK